jgi:hypothetical protein
LFVVDPIELKVTMPKQQGGRKRFKVDKSLEKAIKTAVLKTLAEKYEANTADCNVP